VSEYDDAVEDRLHGRSIGDLLREIRELTDDQIEQIRVYQLKHHVRFGEAAVALKLATPDEVLDALSQQFHYAYAPGLAKHRKDTELVVAANPFSDEAEAFRELRSQLLDGVMAPNAGAPRRAIALVSYEVGVGKTFIAANLAVAFSQLGGRTLLVDADMRTPRLHQVCNVDTEVGLSTILSGRTGQNIVQQVADLPSLYVLPAGTIPPNPLELIQRPAFDLLMGELLRKFNHVVVDTPAVRHGADARVIAGKSGAALVVGRKDKSRMDAMQSLIRKLAKGPATIAGVVMNEY
jgi:chain length determinant protein tyrosine kinase EpsG